jgi:nicotinate phosphoribosyltransferase
VRSGAPIDVFGIGTELATSADAPSLSAVYKLVELRRDNALHYVAKFSDEKSTLPGAKQIYRYPDCDVIALYSECNSDFTGEPLLRPIITKGELLEPSPPVAKLRSKAVSAIAALPRELRSLEKTVSYTVETSPRLFELAESIRTDRQLARS